MPKSYSFSNQLDPLLQSALRKEQERFEETKIPIITVSASSKEDVKGFYGYEENESIPDVVFSRAHYSMALGIAVAAWKDRVDPAKAYVVDPTNFVTQQDWSKITLTEFVGKTLARRPFLKRLKDLVDTFGRQKLPILSSIETPILQLTEHINRPILSMHIAAGNILADQGKSVVQVITDPHVREEYLHHADNPRFFYCVFDEATKAEALEKAVFLKKTLDPDRVIVTGPPIDPRIVRARDSKQAWRTGPLHLCITTGGLGTNSYEIRTLLKQLLPELRKRNSDLSLELMVYASTHTDIFELVKKLAKEERVAVETITERTGSVAKSLNKSNAERNTNQATSKLNTKLKLIYHPQIVDANELLIEHGFPWADGFITKPSGDMAYDAAAAGCFLLTLNEWGEWEHNIRERFETKNIARKCATDIILAQLSALTATSGKSQSWIEQAMNAAFNLDKTQINGATQIIKTYQEVAKKLT